MKIRPAMVADARQIAQVHVSSWQSAYKGLLPEEYLNSLSVEGREDNWKNAITNSPTLIDVCDEAGSIVGFVAYGRGRDEDAGPNQLGEIYAIYLKEESWGKGYGKALLDSAVAALEDESYRTVILWVLSTNEQAIRFYKRNGFIADGQVKTDELSGGIEVTELRYARPFNVIL